MTPDEIHQNRIRGEILKLKCRPAHRPIILSDLQHLGLHLAEDNGDIAVPLEMIMPQMAKDIDYFIQIREITAENWHALKIAYHARLN